MNKSTKGALAAVAAGVLLLGGAGTLAYWSDSGTADAGSITSGSLALSDGTCDDGWVYASGTDAGQPVGTIVPGDSVAKECDFTVTATGDHLSATLTAPSEVDYTISGNTGETLSLPVGATYTVGGTATTTVTSANDGQTVVARIEVTFPYGDATTINANDTQGLTATLNTITVSLTQDQTATNPN